MERIYPVCRFDDLLISRMSLPILELGWF